MADLNNYCSTRDDVVRAARSGVACCGFVIDTIELMKSGGLFGRLDLALKGPASLPQYPDRAEILYHVGRKYLGICKQVQVNAQGRRDRRGLKRTRGADSCASFVLNRPGYFSVGIPATIAQASRSSANPSAIF
ncbi:hypothetical protein [Terrarubrum flagellatum]|uniref:hypothetical protein n=1 Tax=Terrirubrum flagellatum TaxID=2895980 RepID=UPI003144E061